MALTNITTYKKDNRNVYRQDSYKGKGRPKKSDYLNLKPIIIKNGEEQRTLYKLE